MLVFFLVKLLLVSIHLFRIIEKSLGLFRQADLQNGKGREMLRMCLVEWRMLIKMKLINHWVFYSIFKLGGKQLPLNQVHCQMPCKHTCISIFRNVWKSNLPTFLKVYPFLSNIICANIIRMFHVKNTKYNKVTHPTVYVYSIL